jgi:hypothetical protein
MKKTTLFLQIIICCIAFLSCKKEVEVNPIEKIFGNYELKGGFEYRFTDTPQYFYEFSHPPTKISANKGGTPTEIQLVMPYWGTGLVLAEQTIPNVFELKNANTTLRLPKDASNFETFSVQLTGKVGFVDNTVSVNIIGKDESKKLIITYNYQGVKII